MLRKINNYHLFLLILIVFILNTILFTSIDTIKAQWQPPEGVPGQEDANIVTNPLQEDLNLGGYSVMGNGDINVDGGIRNNGIFESTQSVYNTGTSEWTNIGTWSNAQGGETLVLKYYGGRGYNNNINQNVNTEIHLRRSWDGSCDTICVEGYYYDWGGGTDEQILDVSVVQIGGNHASTFDVYVYVEAYSGIDFWEALHDSSSDFVWNNTVTSDPGTGSNIRNLQKTVSFQNGLLNINKDLGTVSVGGDLTVSGDICDSNNCISGLISNISESSPASSYPTGASYFAVTAGENGWWNHGVVETIRHSDCRTAQFFWTKFSSNGGGYWRGRSNDCNSWDDWVDIASLADLNLSNELRGDPNEVDGTRGSWTIQEGVEDLFLINRNTGEKYKFVLDKVK